MQSRIPLGPGKFHVVVLVVNYLVTYHFHFFVGKFPKFFNLSGSMENSFLVASNLLQLTENSTKSFSSKLLYLKCQREWCLHAKIQDRSPSKISSQKQIFSAHFISGQSDFTQDLTSSLLILIHFADASVLVMACVDCVRVCS